MKKTQKCSFLISIFVVFLLFLINFNIFLYVYLPHGEFDFVAAKCENKFLKICKVLSEGKTLSFDLEDFDTDLTVLQQKIRGQSVLEIAKTLKDMGFSKREICLYLYPEFLEILEVCKAKLNTNPIEDYVSVVKNSCKLSYHYNQRGKFINENVFFDNIFEQIIQNNDEICVNLVFENYRPTTDIKADFQEKGYFETSFKTSSDERKNNIRLALSKFDGLVLEAGEEFRFNEVTGNRNEAAGYKAAKIIMNGTFVQGYGGGVCQVSTTIYNACLLAGLEIVEVHQHSLPVSYIEPSFDAMVNSGSSDLIVKNNTGGKVIITTSSTDDKCRVKIFGEENKFLIKRVSKKTGTIPALGEVVETDYEKYGLENLEIGEQHRLSYPKDGFTSSGYLKYYDKGGNLIKTEKIRENKYNATRGVVVKREA